LFFRDDERIRATHDLFLAVAEHLPGGGIPKDDPLPGIEADYGIRRSVDKATCTPYFSSTRGKRKVLVAAPTRLAATARPTSEPRSSVGNNSGV
jgi:hypothetical protein